MMMMMMMMMISIIITKTYKAPLTGVQGRRTLHHAYTEKN